MPINPSIALQAQPPQMQNPLEAYGKVMGIQAMMQQRQINDQEMQMNRMKLDAMNQSIQDQHTMRAILAKHDGDVEKARPELLATIPPDRVLPMLENQTKWEQAKATLKKTDAETAKIQAENIASGYKRYEDAISSIFQFPPEQRNIAYQTKIGTMMQTGQIPDEVAKKMPFTWDDQAFAGFRDIVKQKREETEQLIKELTARKTLQEVTGTQPITAYQQKQLDQQGKPNTPSELAIIASDPNKTPEERKIAKDALAILERHAQASRPVIDMGPTGDMATDPNSQSILAQTGLNYPAFAVLTGQASSLPRDATTRARAMKDAQAWANKKGVDISTLSSQYKTYNEVLSKNIARMNNTKIMEGELQGTIQNLQGVVRDKDLSNLRFANVAKVWAGQEVNDDLAQQYAMHLYQLRNELAAYGAATQGRSGNEITQQDQREAETTIKNGIARGSLAGLAKAVENSTGKMQTVMQGSVERSRKAIWDLFGVGGNYKGSGRAPASGPSVGTVEEGYRFKGGDPSKPENWERVKP